MNLKLWFLETRPQFLLLSVVLIFLGTCIAWYDGYFHLGHAVLAFFGLLFCHIAVNVLNDYHDFRSGIDLRTRRTPFSGGSGFLPAQALQPEPTMWFGLTSFLLAVPIGIYFVLVKGWLLLPLLVIGAVCVLLYTPLFTRLGYPEWAPGMGLGSLPILGTYFVQTGEYTLPALFASIPSGILVCNLLLLNEFPDIEADRSGGRRTMPIILGGKKAALVYSILTGMVYVWVVIGVTARIMPSYTLISLLTIPFAVKAIQGSLNYQDPGKLMPGLANNVLVVLVTQLLLGIGYLLTGIFS